MFLEKQAIDYFRKYEFILPVYQGRLGNSPSRIIGRNMEFEQYHPYYPGDNIKDIDWKILARSDKLFVKNYGSDLSSQIRIVVDNSRSMDYQNKFDIARKIAAIFFYILNSQHNQIYLSTLHNKYTDHGRLQLNQLENMLESLPIKEKSDFSKLLTHRNEVTFFISDLWTHQLDIRFFQKNRIHLLHLLSEDEITLSLTGNFELIDSESGKKFPVIPSRVREKYQKIMVERMDHIRDEMVASGLGYGLFSTATRYYVNLKHFLDNLRKINYRG